MLAWFSTEKIGVLLAAIPIIWGSGQYILIKKNEAKRNQFVTYHDLIKQLVGEDPTKQLMLERQIAIVYELRNFPSYFSLSIRLLNGLKKHWAGINQDSRLDRLLVEINLSITYMEKKISRIWYRA